MALLKLTSLEGAPCLIDFQLVEKVTLKNGKFCIETARTVRKAGEFPRNEPIVQVVQEDLSTILNMLNAFEAEYPVDLFKAKRMLKLAKEE